MARIRPFAADDVDPVAELEERVFQPREGGGTTGRRALLEETFLRHPWGDEAIPSLVCEDRTGRILGFLGVVPRPMLFQGQPIRAAVSTRLMVEPDGGGIAGVQLLRHFLTGPQDLSFTDMANDTSRTLFERLGGSTALLYSMGWTRPLRPVRYLLAGGGAGVLARGARFAARPLTRASDALVARLSASPFALTRPTSAIEELEASHIVGSDPSLLAQRRLHPAYDEASLSWQLALLAQRRRDSGELRRALVRDPGGEVVGWYIYHLDRSWIGQVVQIVARPDRRTEVLKHLFFDAWSGGAAAVGGRLDPALLGSLTATHCRIGHSGAWTLVASKRSEILHAVHRGEALLSGLEGEWWMGWSGDGTAAVDRRL